MKILIDIDNTIYSTGKTIINLWNKYNPNRRLEYKEPLDWKFENILKGTDVELKELFTMFDKEDFYDYVELFDNVEEIINNLSKDNEVIFCSKHCESRKSITAKFIKDEFPNCKLIFVDSFEEKRNIDGDIIIDDKLESLGGVQYCQLLYGDYLWNKGEYYNRVSNWNDIERFVRYIS